MRSHGKVEEWKMSRRTHPLTTSVVQQIKDAVGNDYARPRDVAGENRFAFNSHADSAFDVCFENILIKAPRTPTKQCKQSPTVHEPN